MQRKTEMQLLQFAFVCCTADVVVAVVLWRLALTFYALLITARFKVNITDHKCYFRIK